MTALVTKPMIDPKTLRGKLFEHFGFRRFRPGQAEAIRAAMSGRDILVVMPTGSGKSLCYQLPALELPGATVVVSPLIALMKDQADDLRERGLTAAVVHSGLSAREHREAIEAISQGGREFVFVTPERMADPEFRDLLKQQEIDLFVVDEVHCVSQWGHDFRPEYLALGEAIESLGHPPVLALTATATPDVVEDILRQLRIPDAEIIHTGFYRPNLWTRVVPVQGEDEKRAWLAGELRSSEGVGIVYTATVKAVEALTAFLIEQGIDAAAYHGRLKAATRATNQDRFMSGAIKVMVATNAFGMGIDKPDIRFVIHHHLPATLEAYYQEAGRAGRDGLPGLCTLLFDPEDARLQKFFQSGRGVEAEDLVNAHHALRRLCPGPDAAPAQETALQAISPLPKSRLRAALNVLKQFRVVQNAEGDAGLVLLEPGMDMDDFERLLRPGRERAERDRHKLHQMMEYAETRSCRWRFLLSYFDADEDDTPETCGHCDRCQPPFA